MDTIIILSRFNKFYEKLSTLYVEVGTHLIMKVTGVSGHGVYNKQRETHKLGNA